MKNKLVHIATVTSSHGVQGQFKLFCLLENPSNLTSFTAFLDENGQVLPLTLLSTKGKQPIAALEGVTDKNAADALKQKKIFVQASDFAPTEENFYYSYQLVGLKVLDLKGETVGRVVTHQNYGAGDMLEIAFTNGSTEMIPFHHVFFPEVNIQEGTITFAPPTYL